MKYRFFLFFVPLAFIMALAYRPVVAVSQEDLLRPEKAFATTVSRVGDHLVLTLNVAHGYYVYRDRMQFASDPAGLLLPAHFPAGMVKNDPYFGTQVVFEQQNRILLPLKPDAPKQFTLSVRLQGCAKVGVCYPPYTRKLTIGQNGEGVWGTDWRGVSLPANSAPATSVAPMSLSMLLTFFAAGIGMAFTACMYPLLPILSSLIAGQGAVLTRRRGFVLALAYVQGLALTYTLVGIAAGLTGSLLTIWLQQPAVVLTACALMVLLAMSMFELFNVQLPVAIQSRLVEMANRLPGGRLVPVALMGVVSALIVGPCMAPPLALALGYIGTTGDAWFGGLSLYLMALGMGVPLLLVGTFGGHILPRAGRWMKTVKMVFGVLMLAVALQMAEPFLDNMLLLTLWGALFIGVAVFLRAFDGLSSETPRLIRLGKALGLVLFLVGAAELFGALAGEKNPRYPLAWLGGRQTETVAEAPFIPVSDIKTLERQLAAAPGRPTILDFYADWCVTCKEMDNTTWRDPALRAQLAGFTLLRADVTKISVAHADLLSRFDLFGPPAIIVLDGSAADGGTGRERDRIIGYIDAASLTRRLAAVKSTS